MIKIDPDNGIILIDKISYLSMAPGGHKIIPYKLPIYRVKTSGIPMELDALIISSDLQGVVINDEKQVLLGEYLANHLKEIMLMEELNPRKTGVLLCGDLYADLKERGGLGDVREVWYRFREEFKWVAGISGNHDSFGNEKDYIKFINTEGIYFFTKGTRSIDGIKIAGISGIIGNPLKINRVPEDLYIDMLQSVIHENPDILLLHDSPNIKPLTQKGNTTLSEVLSKAKPH